jgi:hypothetical protein
MLYLYILARDAHWAIEFPRLSFVRKGFEFLCSHGRKLREVMDAQIDVSDVIQWSDGAVPSNLLPTM